MSIIIGVGPESGRMPWALENVSGSFEIALRSAYRVMPHTLPSQ
jgi:hypothetical protein